MRDGINPDLPVSPQLRDELKQMLQQYGPEVVLLAFATEQDGYWLLENLRVVTDVALAKLGRNAATENPASDDD